MALEALSDFYTTTVSINQFLCKGCALCPKVLKMNGIGKVMVSNQSLCTGCRNCESHCPDFAISAGSD
jgi:2-oxoglutarate ferredoxin oxidoreductase subunit delta